MKTFTFLILFLAVTLNLPGQQTVRKHLREINYLLSLPADYEADSTRQWPLLVFLHGSGSTGQDIEKVRRSALPALIDQGKKLPFIVISPQAEEEGWNTRELRNFLLGEVPKYRIDPDRIYLTGLSMGGQGAWDLAVEYPEFFAAVIPICGDPGDAALENIFQLRHTPVWCFHGADDPLIPASASERIIDSLHRYNPDAKLTVYPGVGHDSWTMTYTNDAVWEWLLQQTRYKNQKVHVEPAILQEYASYTYAIPGQTQVARFTVEPDGLRLWVDDNGGQLIRPSPEDTFFLDPDSRKYLIFEKDEKGEVKGLTLYEFNNRIFCRRQ